MKSFIIFTLNLLIMNGVFGDEVKTVKGKEGDSVTLHTDHHINQRDDIMWYNNNTRIARIIASSSQICTDVQCNAANERFRDRLQLNHQTGSLTITNTRTTDSGNYMLQIISSSSSSSSSTEKTFSVIVSAGVSSGVSSGVVAGIIVGVLVAAVLVVGVIFCCRSKSLRDGVHVIYQRTRKQEDQENE